MFYRKMDLRHNSTKDKLIPQLFLLLNRTELQPCERTVVSQQLVSLPSFGYFVNSLGPLNVFHELQSLHSLQNLSHKESQRLWRPSTNHTTQAKVFQQR